MAGDFNTERSQTDKAIGKKISKDILIMNIIVNHLDLTGDVECLYLKRKVLNQ